MLIVDMMSVSFIIAMLRVFVREQHAAQWQSHIKQTEKYWVRYPACANFKKFRYAGCHCAQCHGALRASLTL
jgi:hypothetical protein